MTVQGAELPHGGSRDSAGTQGALGLKADGGGGVRKWSRWKQEDSHLSADPELRSCAVFTHACNHLFLYSFLYFAY